MITDIELNANNEDKGTARIPPIKIKDIIGTQEFQSAMVSNLAEAMKYQKEQDKKNGKICATENCDNPAYKTEWRNGKVIGLCKKHVLGNGVPIRTKHTANRNDPCPCKSGLKFKRCCMNKQS